MVVAAHLGEFHEPSVVFTLRGRYGFLIRERPTASVNMPGRNDAVWVWYTQENGELSVRQPDILVEYSFKIYETFIP
jgi:hypothetical protein